MSEPTVVAEQLKEKKKKKSSKPSEGKSKSSSRKSSSVIPTEDNDDLQSIVPDIENHEGEGAAKNEVVDVKSKAEIKIEEDKKAEERNVVMLKEMDFRKLAELKEAFHLFDIDRDGFINRDDLKFTFTSLGKPDVSDESLDQMLSEMSDEAVDFDAFVKLFGYKAVELDSEEELLAALAKWDYVGNGMISEERIKQDLQSWGDKFSPTEVECALEEAPVYKKDGTTMINYVKFCQNICGLRNVQKTRQIEKEAEALENGLGSIQ